MPQASQVLTPAPTTQATTPRQKTRFDQAEKYSRSSTRPQEHDVYIASDSYRQRDQPPASSSEQPSADNTAKRVRSDDFTPEVASNHRASLSGHPLPAISHPERSTSPAPAATQLDQSRTYFTAFDCTIFQTNVVFLLRLRCMQAPGRDSLCRHKAHVSLK